MAKKPHRCFRCRHERLITLWTCYRGQSKGTGGLTSTHIGDATHYLAKGKVSHRLLSAVSTTVTVTDGATAKHYTHPSLRTFCCFVNTCQQIGPVPIRYNFKRYDTSRNGVVGIDLILISFVHLLHPRFRRLQCPHNHRVSRRNDTRFQGWDR